MHTVRSGGESGHQVTRDVAVGIKISWVCSLAQELWRAVTPFWSIELHSTLWSSSWIMESFQEALFHLSVLQRILDAIDNHRACGLSRNPSSDVTRHHACRMLLPWMVWLMQHRQWAVCQYAAGLRMHTDPVSSLYAGRLAVTAVAAGQTSGSCQVWLAAN